MEFMIFVFVFVAALLMLEGLAELLNRQKDPARVKVRLANLASRVGNVEIKGGESIIRQRGSSRMRNLLALELLLYRAGSLMSVRRFLFVSAAFGVAGFLGVFFFTQDSFRAAPALLMGVIPFLSARSKAGKRMQAFDAQLSNALELVTRSMRSGHSLVAGFQMVSEELSDPISTEFGVVAEEVRLGLELRDALSNLMRRVENENLAYLTTAVLIQRQTGGNLAELLDRLSTLLRERIQFKGRVHALTAQGRGAATFLALWLPGIIGVVWMVAPDYLAPLIENRWGHYVLAAVFITDVLAYILALRIADVEA
jgi:tight adherence protein B